MWKTGIKDLERKQWDKDEVNQVMDDGEIKVEVVRRGRAQGVFQAQNKKDLLME